MPINSADADWLLIGWGARGFYTTTGGYADVDLSTIWRSFTGDSAVLRVDTFGALRDDLALPRLTFSHEGYARLTAAIRDSFAPDSAGNPQWVPVPGFGETDMFFEAQGRFDILRTCNTWVSRMIRETGQPFGAWTPTPYAVTLSNWWFSN